MPRTFSRNVRTYPPGTYGPFSVDQFTNQNTDRLRLTLTAPGGWPVTAAPLLTIALEWDTGGRFAETIDGAGQPNTIPWEIGVPKEGEQKRQVASGTVTLIVHTEPIECSVTLEAIQDNN